MARTTVDKDLRRIVQLENAAETVSRRNVNLGLGILFLFAVWIFASFQSSGIDEGAILVAAAIIGGYMALNIGANDVANNV